MVSWTCRYSAGEVLRPIILYFTADYPDKKTLASFLNEVDPEIVKYVEIGIPTENPLYDGPTVKSTHSVARKQFLKEDLPFFADIVNSKGMEADILAYHEVFKKGGRDYIKYLKDSGIAGAIVPDLLTDYFDIKDNFISELQEKISFIPFFNPATPDSVIEEVAVTTKSWIYYGLQPSTGIRVPYDLMEVSSRIFSLVRDREINFGFGVRSVSDVKDIIDLGSNGVAIGSMLVPMVRDADLESFIKFQNDLKEMIAFAK